MFKLIGKHPYAHMFRNTNGRLARFYLLNLIFSYLATTVALVWMLRKATTLVEENSRLETVIAQVTS